MQTISLCLPLGTLEILHKKVFSGELIMISEVVHPLVGLQVYVVKHIMYPLLVAPKKIPIKLCISLFESTSFQDIVDSIMEGTPEAHVLPGRTLTPCAHILPQEV